MARTCAKCGENYKLRTFLTDLGYCPKCKPGFFSLPAFFAPTAGGTRLVWQFVIGVHLLYLIFPGLILCAGPGAGIILIYSLAVIAYFVIRFVVASIKGFPTLTIFQRIAYLTLPLYGPMIFSAIAFLVAAVKAE